MQARADEAKRQMAEKALRDQARGRRASSTLGGLGFLAETKLVWALSFKI